MAYNKFEQTYVDAYLNNMYPDVEEEQSQDTMLAAGPTAEPDGQVTVSGFKPQQVKTDVQPALGVARPIPQNKAQEALGYIGELLTKAGVQLDKVGIDIPVLGRISLKDLTVGESGKVLEDMALGFYPVEGAGGFISGTTRIKPDPALELLNIAPIAGAAAKAGGKAVIKGATKAVQATKGMPVGMSTQMVGEGVSELGFYSAAKEAVDSIQQPKGTGEQFLKQIEKTPGVKPEEIKWTGLDDFLKSKKTVTKAEVQEYLDKNRVEVKEITLESNNPYPYRNANEWEQAIRREERLGNFDEAERINAAWEDFELGSGVSGVDNTKFSKYTLPGGENYREILLTLPSKDKFDPEKVDIVRNRQSVSQGTYTIKYDNKEIATFSDEFNVADNYKGLSDEQIMNVAKQMYEKGSEYSGIKPVSGGFMSQHFDQPNILAHMRVNDRVDADGKKVLFVEEVQSDWHQAGRKKGYQGTADKDYTNYINDLKVRYEDEIFNFGVNEGMAKDKAKSLATKMANKIAEDPRKLAEYFGESEKQMAMNKARVDERSAVPNAPFKTTWHELALKRAIQLASEGGYDRVAFTTGKTQAERYDLSKQIDDLTITRRDTDFSISATDKSGKPAIVTTVQNLRNLDEIIGKDLANKVKDDFANKSGNEHTYAGLDLQVGGEGMKGFYDTILPKFLDKYAKKWDAKVGTTQIRLASDKQDMADSELLGELGLPKGGKAMADVQYIDITPKMKESVLTKGQPLFAVGGAGAAMQQEDNK